MILYLYRSIKMSPNLITAAKNGDECAFATIVDNVSYDKNGRNKLQLFARKNNYLDTEEDLIQEFKLKIWMAILEYNHKNKIDIETFSWNLIRNWTVDKQRKFYNRRENIKYVGDFCDGSIDSRNYEENHFCGVDDLVKFHYGTSAINNGIDNLEFDMTMKELKGKYWQITNLLYFGFTKNQIREKLNINERRMVIELKKIKKSFGFN